MKDKADKAVCLACFIDLKIKWKIRKCKASVQYRPASPSQNGSLEMTNRDHQDFRDRLAPHHERWVLLYHKIAAAKGIGNRMLDGYSGKSLGSIYQLPLKFELSQ